MTNEEYEIAIQQIMLFCGLVRELDAEGVLERINAAEVIGPFRDPTLYRAAMPKLELIKRCAEAVRAMQNKLPSKAQAEQADAKSAAWQHFSGL